MALFKKKNNSEISVHKINGNTLYVKNDNINGLVVGREVLIYTSSNRKLTNIKTGENLGVYEKVLGQGKVDSIKDDIIEIKVDSSTAIRRQAIQPPNWVGISSRRQLLSNKKNVSYSNLSRKKNIMVKPV